MEKKSGGSNYIYDITSPYVVIIDLKYGDYLVFFVWFGDYLVFIIGFSWVTQVNNKIKTK